MATPDGSRSKWLWIILIALLAILLIVWLLNPSGDREGQVEDPITTPEVSDTGAQTGTTAEPLTAQ